MPFVPGPSNIRGVQNYPIPAEQIESAVLIDQSQLNKSKLFSNRETYVKTLPQGLDYMEIGVAWGYYSKIIAETLSPLSIYLLDKYDQDQLCWSERKFGSCQCFPKHIQTYDKDSHKSFIEKEHQLALINLNDSKNKLILDTKAKYTKMVSDLG